MILQALPILQPGLKGCFGLRHVCQMSHRPDYWTGLAFGPLTPSQEEERLLSLKVVQEALPVFGSRCNTP